MRKPVFLARWGDHVSPPFVPRVRWLGEDLAIELFRGWVLCLRPGFWHSSRSWSRPQLLAYLQERDRAEEL
jgi:hypothetical protein